MKHIKSAHALLLMLSLPLHATLVDQLVEPNRLTLWNELSLPSQEDALIKRLITPLRDTSI